MFFVIQETGNNNEEIFILVGVTETNSIGVSNLYTTEQLLKPENLDKFVNTLGRGSLLIPVNIEHPAIYYSADVVKPLLANSDSVTDLTPLYNVINKAQLRDVNKLTQVLEGQLQAADPNWTHEVVYNAISAIVDYLTWINQVDMTNLGDLRRSFDCPIELEASYLNKTIRQETQRQESCTDTLYIALPTLDEIWDGGFNVLESFPAEGELCTQYADPSYENPDVADKIKNPQIHQVIFGSPDNDTIELYDNEKAFYATCMDLIMQDVRRNYLEKKKEAAIRQSKHQAVDGEDSAIDVNSITIDSDEKIPDTASMSSFGEQYFINLICHMYMQLWKHVRVVPMSFNSAYFANQVKEAIMGSTDFTMMAAVKNGGLDAADDDGTMYVYKDIEDGTLARDVDGHVVEWLQTIGDNACIKLTDFLTDMVAKYGHHVLASTLIQICRWDIRKPANILVDDGEGHEADIMFDLNRGHAVERTRVVGQLTVVDPDIFKVAHYLVQGNTLIGFVRLIEEVDSAGTNFSRFEGVSMIDYVKDFSSLKYETSQSLAKMSLDDLISGGYKVYASDEWVQFKTKLLTNPNTNFINPTYNLCGALASVINTKFSYKEYANLNQFDQIFAAASSFFIPPEEILSYNILRDFLEFLEHGNTTDPNEWEDACNKGSLFFGLTSSDPAPMPTAAVASAPVASESASSPVENAGTTVTNSTAFGGSSTPVVSNNNSNSNSGNAIIQEVPPVPTANVSATPNTATSSKEDSSHILYVSKNEFLKDGNGSYINIIGVDGEVITQCYVKKQEGSNNKIFTHFYVLNSVQVTGVTDTISIFKVVAHAIQGIKLLLLAPERLQLHFEDTAALNLIRDYLNAR